MESSINFSRLCESILLGDKIEVKAKMEAIKKIALLYGSISLVNRVEVKAKMEIIKRVALLYSSLFSKSFYSAYRVNDDDEKPMFTAHVWADEKDGSESETPIIHVLINSRQERTKRSKIKTLGVDTTDDEIELVYMAMLPKIKKLQEFFE